MTRPISPLVTTEIAKPVTAPGFLCEINFPSPLRLSTRGDISWNGGVYIKWGFSVQGIGGDGVRPINGTLVLDDTDLTIATLIFLHGVADRAIRIWKIYGEVQSYFDPVPVFSGVGDDSSSDTTLRRTTIALMESGGTTLYCPRSYITRENGFSVLPARGTVINWNGEQFVLDNDNG